MKKIRGTKYAYIGTSYHPARDAMWEELKRRKAEIDKQYKELFKNADLHKILT